MRSMVLVEVVVGNAEGKKITGIEMAYARCNLNFHWFTNL